MSDFRQALQNGQFTRQPGPGPTVRFRPCLSYNPGVAGASLLCDNECSMSRHGDIPDVCYELLGVIHAQGKRMPYRDLPVELRETGLLEVRRDRRLVELQVWYEPSRDNAVPVPTNATFVGRAACWRPYHRMSRSTVEEAIERDADCDDPKRGLHVGLTGQGDIAFEEWKLTGEKVGSGDTADGQSTVDDGGMPGQLVSLKPSHRRAFLQREYAQKHGVQIEPGQSGDKAAHKWLVEHDDEEGNRLASRDTWLRYLRAARRRLDENNPRRGRPHGPSIAPSNQI